jgi:hypothetical protein
MDSSTYQRRNALKRCLIKAPQKDGGVTMKKIARIGLDLAKAIFQIHAVALDETVVLRKRVSRDKLLKTFENLDREDGCLVGIESCCGSDHWARELVAVCQNMKDMTFTIIFLGNYFLLQ